MQLMSELFRIKDTIVSWLSAIYGNKRVVVTLCNSEALMSY